MAYATVRQITADELATAMNNSADVLRLQTAAGLPSELAVQQTFISRTHLVKGANVYYVAMHFPVALAFLAWVWWRHRSRLARVRNTLIAVTGAGMVLHLAFPLAPPRMLGGFVDTGAVLGPNPYDLKLSAAANQIAAMPSLHVAWALLVGLGVVWILDSPWRFVVLMHPAVTAAVVVVTANHYWIDAIVALTLVAISWVLIGPPMLQCRRRPESGLIDSSS